MSQPSDYFIDADLMEEAVRLKLQAARVTDEMGGPLPELDAARFREVLDLACGPGEWALRVASDFPHLRRIVGVDVNPRMVAYALALAEVQGSPNVEFSVMDITQPRLDFPDGAFDLINGRFLLSFMKKEHWPMLLAECTRILRPGGALRITEQESGFTNDPAYLHYIEIWGEAWIKAGHAFALSRASIGVTVEMKHLMRAVGLVAPQHRPVSIDLSTGQPSHAELLRNLAEALKLASKFLVRTGVIKEKEINPLYRQIEELIGKPGFAAYWWLQTVYAFKPE